MTNDDYCDLRRRYREDAELDPLLASELRQVVSRLARSGGLPACGR